MKILIVFIFTTSFHFQRTDFEQLINNLQSQPETSFANDRSLQNLTQVQNFISEKLPNGMQFVLDKTNIEHYQNIQHEFHLKINLTSEYTEAYDLLATTSLELDQKISSYYRQQKQKYIIDAAIPNEKDKEIFIKFFGELRKNFKECILDIRLNLFTQKAVENCVGKDFFKINNALDFQIRQYKARKEFSLRQVFIIHCYEMSGADPQDCDMIEKDMIDLIWENYSLSENFRENSIKYRGSQGQISSEIYEKLLNIFIHYSEKNEEINTFFNEIYGGFKLKLKEDIQQKERTILEYQAPQKISEPQSYIDTTVDLKSTFEDNDNYVMIDKLPSIKMDTDSKLFSKYKSEALRKFQQEHLNYDEKNYPFKGLKGPKITIPEQLSQREIIYKKQKYFFSSRLSQQFKKSQ